MSFVSRNGGNSASAAGSMKLEHDDNVTITLEEGSQSEHDHDIEASDYDDSYMGAGDESPRLADLPFKKYENRITQSDHYCLRLPIQTITLIFAIVVEMEGFLE